MKPLARWDGGGSGKLTDRNRIALFERDSWLKRLDQAAAVAAKGSNADAIHSSAMNLTEDMTVFQNTLITDDPLSLRSREGVSVAGRQRLGAIDEQAFRPYDELVLETSLRMQNETSGFSGACRGSDGSQTFNETAVEEVCGKVVRGNDGAGHFVGGQVGSERSDRLKNGVREANVNPP